MATHQLLFSQAEQDGATSPTPVSGIAQCDFLRGPDGLPVAQPAEGLCAVAHGLSLLPPLEAERVARSHSHPSARTRAVGGRAEAPGQCGDHRQPERQEHRVQPRAGLRCGQESQGVQASCPRGHPGAHLVGDDPAGQPPGSGWRQTVAGRLVCPVAPSPRQTYLGRWRLHRLAGGVGPSRMALHNRDRQTH